jgi:hypothetical protein
MNSFRRLRALVPVAAVALLAVALLAPSANAANIPPFTSTAQYKALAQFVEKLNGLSNTPAAAAQKAGYEDQLENKHEAAVNKSTALFNRAKNAAKAEVTRAFRKGSQTIRRTEAGELAALRREYDVRMNQASAKHDSELGRVEDEFDRRTDSLRKQVKRLRKQKANAESSVRKAEIQEAIERRTERVEGDRKLLQEEIADLKTGYRREKDAIRSAKAAATKVVQQDDNEAIEALRNRNNRIYNTKVRTLQNRRANQLGNLELKLNAGRAAIGRMPVAG